MIVSFVFEPKKCPFCGVGLKPENIWHHIERVHPTYGLEATQIPIDNKCHFCGRSNDLAKTKYHLPICTSRYVSDIRKFMVRDLYLELVKKNNADLKEDPEAAGIVINGFLNAINELLSWIPENISQTQYLYFCEVSYFTGYLLLRTIQLVPKLGDILLSISLDKTRKPLSNDFKMKANRLVINMSIEFELFLAAKFASCGFFDIATDNEQNPKEILIIPACDYEGADRILFSRLKDANSEWRGTFRKVLVPTGTSSAQDECGRIVSFQRKEISKHFKEFKDAWKKVFGTDPLFDQVEFEKLWDYFKWVTCPDGLTSKNTENATFFEDYESFKMSREMVFGILNDILPDLNSRIDVISTKNLTRNDPYLRILGDLASVAHGFRLNCSAGWIYFLTCREWFYNTIMPTFVDFIKRIRLEGSSFERDIASFCAFYSKMGILTGGLSSVGLMVEPATGSARGKKIIPSSRDTPWRVLGKSVPISMPLDDITAKIGAVGEVDLIVYANMSVYLIELKATELDSKKALKYCRDKAPLQCAKYSYWIKKSPDFNRILKENGIDETKIKSVRVVVCSSGGFPELLSKCEQTNESFAIVPEYILFSIMAGLFTLSLKDPFPQRIFSMVPGMRLAKDNSPRILQMYDMEALRKRISGRLVEWMETAVFDRRKAFTNAGFNEENARSVSFLSGAWIMNELYVGGVIDWVLPEPLLVGEAKGYRFYLGTQVGEMGTSVICTSCKSAIRFYWPRDKNDSQRVSEILKKGRCPLCESKSGISKPRELLQLMMQFMIEIKRGLWYEDAKSNAHSVKEKQQPTPKRPYFYVEDRNLQEAHPERG